MRTPNAAPAFVGVAEIVALAQRVLGERRGSRVAVSSRQVKTSDGPRVVAVAFATSNGSSSDLVPGVRDRRSASAPIEVDEKGRIVASGVPEAQEAALLALEELLRGELEARSAACVGGP